jgi:hypothetical protein
LWVLMRGNSQNCGKLEASYQPAKFDHKCFSSSVLFRSVFFVILSSRFHDHVAARKPHLVQIESANVPTAFENLSWKDWNYCRL